MNDKKTKSLLSVINFSNVFNVQYNCKAKFCHHARPCSKKKSKVTRYPDCERT